MRHENQFKGSPRVKQLKNGGVKYSIFVNIEDFLPRIDVGHLWYYNCTKGYSNVIDQYFNRVRFTYNVEDLQILPVYL